MLLRMRMCRPGGRQAHEGRRRDARALRGATVVAGLSALALLVAGSGAAAAPGADVVANDGRDGRGALDLARVAFGSRAGGRLRGEWRTQRTWSVRDLAHPGGPPGSLCFRVWTRRVPGVDPPDYLVCAVPGARGRLSASVLRDRPDGGPPRRVAAARLRRLGGSGLAVSFAARAIGTPARLRVAAETTTWKGCPRPVGCLDTAPGTPSTLRLVL